MCVFFFFGIVDDVVDKSDDNEESDSENDTDNEDVEKDQCAEVMEYTHMQTHTDKLHAIVK